MSFPAKTTLRLLSIPAILCAILCAILVFNLSQPAEAKRGKHSTVKAAIKDYGETMRRELIPLFQSRGLSYPPKELTFIGLKEEKVLHIFAKDHDGENIRIKTYPIVGVSGEPGPKLEEGDRQIPEGIYKLTGFKPNSIAHLALLINYPSPEDRKRGREDKRTNLGSHIEIHGSYWSTGCLAMGDEAIEEIFVLAHDTGLKQIDLILSPCNLNIKEPVIDYKEQPKWLPALYGRLKEALKEFDMVPDKSVRYPWSDSFLLK